MSGGYSPGSPLYKPLVDWVYMVDLLEQLFSVIWYIGGGCSQATERSKRSYY